jgi:RND family efflux transporter MFP subunit
MVCLVGCQTADNEYKAPPPPEITVARPLIQPLTPFLEERGVIEAVDEAEVRARVQGFVQVVDFQPGAQVSAGELLYEIEPDRYQAIVESSKAAVESAEAAILAAQAAVVTNEAEVKVSQQNLDREKRLLDQRAGSQSDYDEAVAAKDSALAALEYANANVEVAKAEKGQAEAKLAEANLDLGYTRVVSPIEGMISITDVKEGNLVENGTRLAAVVNRSEVYVNFSISDRQMLRFLDEQQSELEPGETPKKFDPSTVPVYLHREIDAGFPFTGALNYVDQEGVDADTGTLGMRAKFDNPQDQLYPGLFVTVRLPTGEPRDAMLIPQQALLRDQVGQYVLTVDSQQTVQRTPVQVDRIISGWAVIESGLTADTQVVVDGLQLARPRLQVNPKEQRLQADDDALLRGLTPTGIFANSPDENAAAEQTDLNESNE